MTSSSPLENELFVEEGEETLRLDSLLALRFSPSFSRSYFEKLIEEGFVTSEGRPLKKRDKLPAATPIEIFFRQEESGLVPEAIPLEILFEDEDLLIINKPCGLVVHPAPGHPRGTFANALLYHCTQLASISSIRPGIVHRLDKETSGLLIGAKHEEAQRRLIALFQERRVEKEYLAICLGTPLAQRVETLIGRNPKERKKMANVEEGGKIAISYVLPLRQNQEKSLVSVKIETGRTHQVRLHMAHLGCPIFGDALYGFNKKNREAERLFLHAFRLAFPHPIKKGEEVRIEAPIPAPFLSYFVVT